MKYYHKKKAFKFLFQNRFITLSDTVKKKKDNVCAHYAIIYHYYH